MARFPLTAPQQEAVTTVGRSLIVSAAAGSGKTSVLAERCAYLVCDAPPAARCDVDRLLVLTFTEAAAGEMRQRIIAALRERLAATPGDHRLREQVALADAARISTIHAFCLWIIRRHFSEAQVDPTAPLLDEHEAAMLRQEVLDDLIRRLYAAARGGDVEDAAPEDVELGRAFVELVDVYGLGHDHAIAAVTHSLALFLDSLPDPQRWLDDAIARLAGRRDELLIEVGLGLADELAWQIEHLEALMEQFRRGPCEALFYVDRMQEFVNTYAGWLEQLAPLRDATQPLMARLASFGAVRTKIGEFKPNPARRPKSPQETPEDVEAAIREMGAQWSDTKAKLWRDRIRKRYGLFSILEWREGLDRIAPFARTLGSVATRFRAAYGERKRQLGVLDFSDLERFALAVLREPGEGLVPSAAARTLQRRFDHVLVDEFQDVSPIQDAIIRLVSRESDAARADNLFVVGDVKQSIYRFRLAEPEVFLDRLRRFSAADAEGRVVTLPDNFRSRPEILDAVNILFRALMRESIGGIPYDKSAELAPGRQTDAAATKPIELHLLDRKFNADTPNHASAEPHEDADDDDAPDGATDNPADWEGIEREAYLVGRRIQGLIRAERRPDGTPWRYSDVAILLRSTSVAAEKMATRLARLGIPAHADAGGSLLAAVEIRDVLSALRVFDNPRQDIPLAALMRRGLIAPPFSDDNLVSIRCLDRTIPFHEAVFLAADSGETADQVRGFLDAVSRWREAFRRRPLAEALSALYEETALPAQVGGLPGGAQRRANLERLHDLARQFAAFRIQGLHRFLRFVHALDEREQRVDRPSALGEAEDVVRILSIHRSKGLEFPVVFVAGLGTKFNLADRSGLIVFERRAGLGLRVIEPERSIEYESCARSQVAGEIERQSRAEEMRILYVALTRARERLILVGSVENAVQRVERELTTPRTQCGTLSLHLAAAPLDWILPALATAAGQVSLERSQADPSDGPREAGEARFAVVMHAADDVSDWGIDPPQTEDVHALHAALTASAPLPPGEPIAPRSDEELASALARLSYVYPHAAAAGVRAAAGASELKGLLDAWTDPQERRPIPRIGAFARPPSRYAPVDRTDALYRGTLTHRVLQHLDLAAAGDGRGLAAELDRLTTAGIIAPADAGAVDAAALTWFLGTPLAERLRAAGPAYRREFSFVAREPLALFLGDASAADDAPGDVVLVRGIVDGILVDADGLELVDYKTDTVDAAGVDARTAIYRTQMVLYGRAMARLFARPVRASRLVFLSARRIVDF